MNIVSEALEPPPSSLKYLPQLDSVRALAVLLVLATYETVVFAIGVIANRNRTLAAIGLVAVVVQVLVSVRSICLMIQGV